MSVTVKQLTEAIDLVTRLDKAAGFHGKTDQANTLSMDKFGVRGQTAIVWLPETIEAIDQPVYALPDTLKKAAKEAGKPGSPIKVRPARRDHSIDMNGIILPVDPHQAEKNRTFYTPGGWTETGTLNVTDLAALAEAASTDDMRPVLKQVQVTPEHAAATDSYRLYVDRSISTDQGTYLIPKSVIMALKWSKTDTVKIGVEPTQTTDIVHIEGTTPQGNFFHWSARQEAGQFPKIDQLFPDIWDWKVDLNTDQATAQAAKLNRWAKQNRPGTIEIGNGKCTFAYDGPSTDPSVSPATVGTIERFGSNEPPTIGINTVFLAAALDYAGETLEAISPLRPMLFSKGSREAMVMPIRLNE